MKLTIERLSKKNVTTKFGEKMKLGIFYQDKWYGAWEADWNKSWQEGDVIEADVEEREYNGTTYYDLKKPDPIKAKLIELERRIEALEDPVNTAKKVFNTDSRDEPPSDWI